MENQIPQLSLETLIRLSTHERREVAESSKTADDTWPRRGICLKFILSLPPDQGRRIMKRLLAEAEQVDDAPSMRLVEKTEPDFGEEEPGDCSKI